MISRMDIKILLGDILQQGIKGLMDSRLVRHQLFVFFVHQVVALEPPHSQMQHFIL